MHGYDPVAYFVEGEPTKGLEAYEITWRGATWRFASASNRDLFIKHAEKYAPQYGGYCALGMSANIIDDGSPTAWAIVDDKLYLNYNQFYHLIWKLAPRSRITLAERHWPTLDESYKQDNDQNR